ncbi:Acg family FMN-binding oxidoreductase [Nocardia takedensis]|uniref:Acg family FMN-binding oxidoreductase n=1 Tax=Nocardia takedensis TaxID=259390 RepID=UPI003F767FA6
MDLATPEEPTVRAALEQADRAPSLHNSQPWLWRWDGRRLGLWVDPRRMLPSTDAFNRQGVIGCGAVLHHAVTAFAATGWPARVERFPRPTDRACLATLEFERRREPAEGDRELADAIEQRYTDREPYAADDRWPDLVPVLDGLCRDRDLRLADIDDTTRAVLAHVSWTASATRRRDPLYQAELSWWLGAAGPAAGVPASALPTREDAARVPLNRAFLSGSADPGPQDTDHGHIVALLGHDDSPQSLLACGEALSAVLLECTVYGLSTCVMSHLTELPATRARVVEALGEPHPQIFVRAGRATAPRPPRTPRRPIEDVLIRE